MKYIEKYNVLVHRQNNSPDIEFMQPYRKRLVFRANQQNSMKKVIAFVFFFGVAALTFGQNSEERSVGDFSGIKSSEGIDVYLKKGTKESVRVEVSGTSLSNVLTEVSGDFLKIHMRENRYRGNVNVKVYVTYVSINKISASSASNVYSQGPIKASRLSIGASSAASIEIAVEVGSIDVSTSSAADIELEGIAQQAEYEASSAGEIDADDLKAEKVRASASSAGSIRVWVSEDFVGRASSGASIRYRGSPTKSNTDASSGGSVRKSG